MSREEDFAAAEGEAIHNPGIIKLQREELAKTIQSVSYPVTSIKEKKGHVEDYLQQLEEIIKEGRRYDPYANY